MPTLLKDLAHARSGDKTGSLNIGVVITDPDDFDRVRRALRPDRILAALGLPDDQPVDVFDLPNLGAFNLYFPGALHGAPTETLLYDVFGHFYGARILSLEVGE